MINSILCNGFVTAIDRSTGQDVQSCLMSVLVDREAFLAIDLSRVEPKVCFKNLKGVSAASLSALAAIAPVMELNRDDRRFVDGREIGDSLDEATNLADMDWEDFEDLVRDLFEGANLLHLLERHGMKAKIDLQAAREARLSS